MAAPLLDAWVMSDAPVVDQRAANRCEPNKSVSIEHLARLGVYYRKMDPATMLDKVCEPIRPTACGGKISEVERFMEIMGYATKDEVCCSPDKLENYDQKLKNFFEEHIHEDEEIRLIKEGSGYFDVRDDRTPGEPWVRIHVKAGDLIILPAGIMHRFTMDELNFTHAIRLFSEAPKWTPVNRADGEVCTKCPARLGYLRTFVDEPLPARMTPCGGYFFGGGGETAATHGGEEVPVDQDVFEVVDPVEFDATVRCAIKKMHRDRQTALVPKTTFVDTKTGDRRFIPYILIFYFTGAHYPRTHQSWCPDCVASDPIVKAEYQRMKASYTAFLADPSQFPNGLGEDGYPVARPYFIHCPVERGSYLNNPAHPYRRHPFVELRSVPTLLICAATAPLIGGDVLAIDTSATKADGAAPVGADIEDEDAGGIRVVQSLQDVQPDWLHHAARILRARDDEVMRDGAGPGADKRPRE